MNQTRESSAGNNRTSSSPCPDFVRRVLRDPFAGYAILLLVLFVAVHLLGFREYVGIISGTESADAYHPFYAVIYIILYISLAIAVPILLIAGILCQAVLTIAHRRKHKRANSDPR